MLIFPQLCRSCPSTACLMDSTATKAMSSTCHRTSPHLSVTFQGFLQSCISCWYRSIVLRMCIQNDSPTYPSSSKTTPLQKCEKSSGRNRQLCHSQGTCNKQNLEKELPSAIPVAQQQAKLLTEQPGTYKSSIQQQFEMPQNSVDQVQKTGHSKPAQDQSMSMSSELKTVTQIKRPHHLAK